MLQILVSRVAGRDAIKNTIYIAFSWKIATVIVNEVYCVVNTLLCLFINFFILRYILYNLYFYLFDMYLHLYKAGTAFKHF